MTGLRVNRERQACGLGKLVYRIEAAVAEVDAVDVDREHSADNAILAMLDEPLQLLDGRRWVLAGDEANPFRRFRSIGRYSSRSQRLTARHKTPANSLSRRPLTERATRVPKMMATSILSYPCLGGVGGHRGRRAGHL